MQTKTKWMLAGSAAVLVALLGWAFAPRPTLVELAEAKPGLFEAGIEEDGKTRLRDRYGCGVLMVSQVRPPLVVRCTYCEPWNTRFGSKGDTSMATARVTATAADPADPTPIDPALRRPVHRAGRAPPPRWPPRWRSPSLRGTTR